MCIASVTSFYFVYKSSIEKEFNEKLEDGQKYLQNLDYEKAEDSYLEAINIDSKNPDPYIQLADVYIAQGKKDEAIGLLDNAKKKVASHDKKAIEDKKTEIKAYAEYSWIVEPKIEADDIFYLKSREGFFENNRQKQMMSTYTILKKDNLFYLVDMSGNILSESFTNIYPSQEGGYLVNFLEPYYDNETSNYYESGYVSPSGKIIIGDEGEDFGLEMVYKDMLTFIYDESINENLNEQDYEKYKIYPMPVQKVKSLPSNDFYKWRLSQNEKYGICSENGMITDFIYDEIGSYSEGLMAVKKNNKWGYVDKKGKIIIPIEYDASWNHYQLYTDSGLKDYCYAACEGYASLRKGKLWELRDTNGKLVIPSGIFETILPVYRNQCWVKKDGKWGVIELVSKKVKNNKSFADEDKFKEYIGNQNLLYFIKEDFDNDGIEEAFGITGNDGEYGTSDVNIYFMSSTGNIELIKSDTYGYLNYDSESQKKYLNINNAKFVVWEQSAGGPYSLSFIFGVKNGKYYEPEISGEYMDFWRSRYDYDGIDIFVGYKSDFSKGYHEWIPYGFIFDEDRKEFIPVDERIEIEDEL